MSQVAQCPPNREAVGHYNAGIGGGKRGDRHPEIGRRRKRYGDALVACAVQRATEGVNQVWTKGIRVGQHKRVSQVLLRRVRRRQGILTVKEIWNVVLRQVVASKNRVFAAALVIDSADDLFF